MPTRWVVRIASRRLTHCGHRPDRNPAVQRSTAVTEVCFLSIRSTGATISETPRVSAAKRADQTIAENASKHGKSCSPANNVRNRRDEAYLAHSCYSECQCMDRKQSD